MDKFIVVIVLLATSSVKAEPVCVESYRPPKLYLKVKEEVDKSIDSFANNPIVAKQADNLLSKLLKVKSPILTSWVKKRNLSYKDEVKIVREWRKYFAIHFILSKYPHGISEVDRLVEGLAENAKRISSSQRFVKRMERLFLKAQKASIARVKKWNLKEKNKKDIAKRISEVKLYWMDSFKNSKFKNSPLDYIQWGIAYDPVPNEVNMGVEALAYPNDETYLAVFVHEMGHSFDACRWGAFFEGKWPFSKVEKCLRSSRSVGAKKRDDSKLLLMRKKGKISAALVQALRMNPTCNKRIYPPIGVQADQLSESFADWFSAEVLAELKIKNKLKIRMDLCRKKSLVRGSSYVKNEDRLKKIYFSHPRLSAKPSHHYCAFN